MKQIISTICLVFFSATMIKAQDNFLPADTTIVLNLTTKHKFFEKNDVVVYSLCFVSGVADGFNETIKFHYLTFKRVSPHANDQFWNTTISWRNKNKNWFTKLVPIGSDGYHLTRGVSRITLVAAVAFSSNDLKGLSFKKATLKVVKKFALSMISNRIGQYIVYDVIYKQ